MKLDRISKKAFDLLFHLVLSLMLIDWAVKLPGTFYGIGIYEVAFLLLGCVCLVRLYYVKGEVFRQTFRFLRMSKWSAISLVAYLLMGVVTLFYARTVSYALTKYIVVIQMLFYGVCLFHYVSSCEGGGDRAIKSIYLNMGVSAVISAVWGLVDYFFCTTDVYPAIISPINDYNQYTTILLVGWVSVGFFAVRSDMKTIKKYTLLSTLCCVLVPSISAAGSRRSYAIMMVVVVILFGVALFTEVEQFVRKKEKGRRLAAGICAVLLCAVCTFACSSLLTNTVTARAGMSVGKDTTDVGVPDDFLGGDIEANHSQNDGALAWDRIEASSGMGKREIIWRAAIHEIQQFDTTAILFGKGASYSSDMYDDVEKPLVKDVHESYGYSDTCKAEKNWMNAHNLFLQDMLEGGVVLLLCLLGIIAAAVWYTVRVICRDPLKGCVLGLLYGILLVTLLLSPAHGMISNKWFWLITMLQISQWYVMNNTRGTTGKVHECGK